MIDQINQLGDISNAEKAAILSAVTHRPIPLDELVNFLDFNDLFYRDAISGNSAGSLVDYVQNNSGPLADGVSELIRHIRKPLSEQVSSHEPQWALKAASVLAGLVAAAVVTQEQADEVLALGGGLVNGPVTEQEVIDAIAAHEAQVAQDAADQAQQALVDARLDQYQSLYNSNIAPLLDSGNSDGQAWSDALAAMHSAFVI